MSGLNDNGWIEAIKIIVFATVAAIVYGILHDQVTAHLCVEYFTIAHPPLLPTESPFLLAIGWGIVATWWVGLPLGLGLAAAARIGPAPRLGLADLKRPIIRLMIVSGIGAFVSGAAGALLFATGRIGMPGELEGVPGGWRALIPVEKHVAFTADAWAHSASYGFGMLGGLFVIGWAVWQRVRNARGALRA